MHSCIYALMSFLAHTCTTVQRTIIEAIGCADILPESAAAHTLQLSAFGSQLHRCDLGLVSGQNMGHAEDAAEIVGHTCAASSLRLHNLTDVLGRRH